MVNFLDHINMPNFHLSSLDGNTTPKKNPQIGDLKNKTKKFKQNDFIYIFLILLFALKFSRTMF